MLLPGGPTAEQMQREQAMQAAIGNLRINVASQIFTRLVVDEFQRSMDEAVEGADPFGTGEKPDEPIPFQVNLVTPARFAFTAAMAFIIEGGLVSPEDAQKMQKPHANNGDQ